MASEDYDVIVIGAGISGVCAAYRLQEQCPDRTYTILEARNDVGGTWDQFRFPGIRSDSDLYTFGFPFRPWSSAEPIATAPSILKYMKETMAEFGIDKKVQFRHKLASCDWSSELQNWTLNVDHDGQKKRFKSKFIICASGYYNYDKPLATEIPGISKFQGTVAHPQFWPEDLDYTDKNVVIVGSGATAVTVLPAMATKAAHTTMLQRSPGYVVSIAQDNAVNRWARYWLPTSWAHQFIRMRAFLTAHLFYLFCRRYPNAARKLLRLGSSSQLPKDYPLDPNFNPAYNPWDQRLCLCPDGDFYKAIKSGRASIETDTIKTVTEKSIVLASGNVLYPDIIVTATGLQLQAAGGATISVDSQAVDIPHRYMWKGMMLQDVPNLAIVMGYGNASWTLGADATTRFVARMLNYQKKKGFAAATPTVKPGAVMVDKPILALQSTYLQRGMGHMPRAGDKGPWRPRSMYLLDLWDALYGNIANDMAFVRPLPVTA